MTIAHRQTRASEILIYIKIKSPAAVYKTIPDSSAKNADVMPFLAKWSFFVAVSVTDPHRKSPKAGHPKDRSLWSVPP